MSEYFILTIGVSVLILAFLFRCVYRVTLHPLATYPGPLLAKLTDGYAAYHGLLGDLHIDICRCHKKYGSPLRYGPNRVVFNSHQALEDIYGFSKNVKKSKAYLTMVPNERSWSTLTTIDKNTHRAKRKIISQSFSEKALKDCEPALQQHIDVFCEKLGEGRRTIGGWTEGKIMHKWFKRLTLDSVCQIGFGRKLDLLEKPDNRFILDVLHAYSSAMGVYIQFPELAKLHLEWLVHFFSGNAASSKFKHWVNNFGSSILEENNETHQSLFSRILNSPDPKVQQIFPESELWAEGIFLMLAGSDTTSVTFSALVFYLSQDPEAYDRLTQEIRTKFPDKELIRGDSLLWSCTYLQACIDEAMRMSPPTSGSPWREVQAGGIIIAGDYIPSGYDVGCCLYAVHHNEEHFPDSYKFMPERWLPTSSITLDEHHDVAVKSFKPFSLGPRSCAGRSMALLELSLTTAKLLWSLDFRRVQGEAGRLGGGDPRATNGRHRFEEYQLTSHITSTGSGPVLQFRPRFERDSIKS